jgi:hypothetical protein
MLGQQEVPPGVGGLDSASFENNWSAKRSGYGHYDCPSRVGAEAESAAGSLIPNFDFVAIRVSDVGIGAARTEFAPPEQFATGVLDFVDSRVDVPG